jgi:hypothetical protein
VGPDLVKLRLLAAIGIGVVLSVQSVSEVQGVSQSRPTVVTQLGQVTGKWDLIRVAGKRSAIPSSLAFAAPDNEFPFDTVTLFDGCNTWVGWIEFKHQKARFQRLVNFGVGETNPGPCPTKLEVHLSWFSDAPVQLRLVGKTLELRGRVQLIYSRVSKK